MIRNDTEIFDNDLKLRFIVPLSEDMIDLGGYDQVGSAAK